jgi:hypothetical protein
MPRAEQTSYIARAFNATLGRTFPIFPRSKKTARFASAAEAEQALQRFSRRLGTSRDIWQGRIYAAPMNPEDAPLTTLAL